MDRRPQPPAPVRRGEILELDCERMADGPDALAKVGSYVIFVRGALGGERVRARVTSGARKHGRADVLEVLKPSNQRAEPGCRYYESCGGCQLQHMAIEGQWVAKSDRVRKLLSFTLGRKIEVAACIGPADPWHQRTKVALHVVPGPQGGMIAGHLRPRSLEVVEIDECPAADGEAFRIARELVRAAERTGIAPWDPETDRGVLRAVVVRTAPSTRQAHAVLVVREAPRARLTAIANAGVAAGATGVSSSLNDGPFQQLLGEPPRLLAGERYIEDEVDGQRFRISPGAFFQTSAFGTRALVEHVTRILDAPDNATVYEFYAGGGLLGLSLARSVGRVVLVEGDPAGAGDAKATVDALGIRNAAVRQGAVEKLAPVISQGQKPPFAVLLDPPRAGCRPNVLHAVTRKLRPQRIVYVSCDPDSLARDAALLEREGYRLTVAQPIDMFPHTHHVEVVARFEAKLKRDPARQRLLERAARNLRDA